MRRLLTVVAPVLGAALFAPQVANAGQPGPDQVEPGVDQNPLIYGGTAAKTCGWPSTVSLSFGQWSCSGTLVHPDIVITAAHCPDSTSGKGAQVSFGEGFGGGERNVNATCYSNPGWTGQVGPTDFGYCKLNTPVTDVPIIPPAWGCDTSGIVNGREVVIVGFGNSDNGGSGSKREVTTTIAAIGDQAVIGGGGKDACQGDSGGPVFIKLKSEFGGDDTWRAFGITSGGGTCGQGGIFSLMHVAIPWIESHSGVDITPCQDSDGNWAPTPECGQIPLEPADTNGASWNKGCSGGPVSGFSELCGDAFGSGEDSEPPSVAIVDPIDGQEFDLGGDSQISVSVSVDADDGDGFGVADVQLLINGQEFTGNTDGSAPYGWDLVFPKGGYVIEAIATDWSGNVSPADAIAIGVGQAAPESPDPDPTTGGDGDPTGGDEGPSTTGDSGGLGDTGGDLGLDETDSGCNCSTDTGPSRSGPVWALLSLLGLAGVRRRRGR